MHRLLFALCPVLFAQAAEKPFTMLTDELLAKLPEAQLSEWTAYLAKSKAFAAEEHRILDEERTKAEAKPAPGNSAEFEFDSDTPAEWFASAENQKLAEIVISYQTPTGGWSKAVDYTKGPRQSGTHWTSQKGDAWHYCGTFDNRTTTEQIKFLAGVFTATKREDVKAALTKGLDYVFAAQYPNGGWPQNYPVERGYHEAITLNDDAMIHILEVLHDLAEGNNHFAFADAALKQRAQAAFDKGIACIAAMQVRIDGQPTVWCAQHHPPHARARESPRQRAALAQRRRIREPREVPHAQRPHHARSRRHHRVRAEVVRRPPPHRPAQNQERPRQDRLHRRPHLHRRPLGPLLRPPNRQAHFRRRRRRHRVLNLPRNGRQKQSRLRLLQHPPRRTPRQGASEVAEEAGEGEVSNCHQKMKNVAVGCATNPFMTQHQPNQSLPSNILLTPGEAARLNIESLGQSDSDGLGALGVPAVFKSTDMLYRIRLTILNRMGSTTPGRSLEVKREEFLADFQNSVTFSTHHMLKAQWKYVEQMRDAIYQSLRSVIALSPPKRDFEAASLLRAFVQPLRQRGERADFELFRAYVGGFIDLETTVWLEQIWKQFQIDLPQTFWRRISAVLNHFFKKT